MLRHLWSLMQNPVARAIGISFFISGYTFGSWTSCIPYVKTKFQLDEAELGLMLLSMPVGGLVMNSLIVYALRHLGLNRSVIIFSSMMGVAFALPVFAPSIFLACAALFISGGVFACHNVAMNTYASNLEVHHGMRLMSTCHGMWSLGAMLGALLTSSSFGLWSALISNLHPQISYFIFVAIAIFILAQVTKNSIFRIQPPVSNSTEKPKVASIYKPNGTLLLLTSILICTYFTEGTMADWSAVYMEDMLDASPSLIGWGYAMYAALMAFGRFIGDELIHRYSNMIVLRIGGFLVIAGMLWIILVTNALVALPGFMLVGLGISLASPILYAASARVPGLAPGAGLATMNSFGMVSFLTGPVIVGFIAKMVDLRFAFILVIVTALIWVIQTSRVIRKKISL